MLFTGYIPLLETVCKLLTCSSRDLVADEQLLKLLTIVESASPRLVASKVQRVLLRLVSRKKIMSSRGQLSPGAVQCLVGRDDTAHALDKESSATRNVSSTSEAKRKETVSSRQATRGKSGDAASKPLTNFNKDGKTANFKLSYKVSVVHCLRSVVFVPLLHGRYSLAACL